MKGLKMTKVFVGMSGGVDSSVSAALLVEQGYDVTGIYMKNWSRDLPGMKCPWADDLADAKRVAVKLGIPFEVWDFEDAYREKVVEYMLREFKAGNTPNPDIMCNEEIKFKLFYETAMKRGADFIATGHYARVGVEPQNDLSQGVRSLARRGVAREPRGDGSERRAPRETILSSPISLLRATDENKDQTYFLYRISDEALTHTLFPIGGMLKPDVKKLAAEKGLHNAYKKESMGVCFVGEVGMKDFLKEYIDIKPGEIREAETERVLGYHEGAIFYTIGQRHGLYLSGNKGEANTGLPYYVVAKDLERNILYVSQNLNHSAIWTKELKLKDVLMRSKVSGAIHVRLRHRAPLIPAVLRGDTLIFESEIKRPASGQSAVFYDGEICLGGGIIA
ncbi:tRNA-specific 2-thiouridylase [Candidatus Saccharibacteria bacterium]|nr:tRNA-specific 2-thiouridylase [Candidatus Saccharibacteria bacterium]